MLTRLQALGAAEFRLLLPDLLPMMLGTMKNERRRVTLTIVLTTLL
jgi:hypothetical protein